MTQKSTDELITSLAQGLRPVRVLPSPGRRAVSWLVGVGLLLTLLVWRKGHIDLFVAQQSEARMVIESVAILLTGTAAVACAFWLSVPGGPRWPRYLVLPPLIVWLATSGLGCLRHGLGIGPPGARLGDSTHCFAFIVAISIPLSVWLFAMLRRAQPLEPLQVALTAGLGVSALAAFVLRFFHPFDITLLDLAIHAAAIMLVIGVAGAARGFLSAAVRNA